MGFAHDKTARRTEQQRSPRRDTDSAADRGEPVALSLGAKGRCSADQEQANAQLVEAPQIRVQAPAIRAAILIA